MTARRGEAWATFVDWTSLETDDCLVWPFARNRAGYGIVKIPYGSTWLAHRLALQFRISPPAEGLEAAHGPCHNPACFNYRHLRWATRAENHDDLRRDGTLNIGTRNGANKLTEGDVHAIRARLAAGEQQKHIAPDFGVSAATVGDIARGDCWSWLPDSTQPRRTSHALL